MPSILRACALGVACALAVTGCGASVRRFSRTAIVWDDPDRRTFGPAPPAWYSPYFWDGVDNSSFRPLSEALRLELDSEAVNVNAMDEVPDSSWYTRRLASHRSSPATVAAGACEDEDEARPGVDDDVHPPFVITRGKPDGSNPGFFVRDGRGRLYLMKPDHVDQLERASAADAIGAAVFHAAGYFTPCNRVVYVAREDLDLAPDAMRRTTDGRESPLTETDVDAILGDAITDREGRIRASLSRFIDGEPIAPWTYTGTWSDDPNDVVPHQHRRDVRAMFILSAWLSHIDSRQENTMAAFMAYGDVGYVRHYMIDFSDTLGITYPDELMTRRFGHSGYVDFQSLGEDLVTLGAIDRPWEHARFGPAGPTLGYFDLERFDPEHWRPGYPNPAYERMTEHDAAWMARILARFEDRHVAALAARGRFGSPIVTSELTRILIGRRQRILERWLTRLSPLTDPRTRRATRTICLEDRAVTTSFRDRATRRYEARAWSLDPTTELAVTLSTEDAGPCVQLPPELEAAYVLIDVIASSEGRERTAPLRLHVEVRGGRVAVLGLERPEHEGAPQ